MSNTYKECPICKLHNQEILNEFDYGDKVTYSCERCGKYTISGSAEAIANASVKASELSGWLRERNILEIEIPMLTSDFLKEVEKTLPQYTPIEKQNKLLNAIQIYTEYPGQDVRITSELDISLAWARNEEEFSYYVKSLIQRKLIEISSASRSIFDAQYPVVITAHGWEHLESNKTDIETKNQVFVAMSFDDSLLGVYSNAIHPAIKATGYRAYRVDAQPHLERIDAKIVSEIKNSKFMVADVTQQKAGVYYEAGLAHGLGMPVIWCVHEDDLKNVHFDTRQYSHILWKNEEELQQKLYDFILATIGRNNLTSSSS